MVEDLFEYGYAKEARASSESMYEHGAPSFLLYSFLYIKCGVLDLQVEVVSLVHLVLTPRVKCW